MSERLKLQRRMASHDQILLMKWGLVRLAKVLNREREQCEQEIKKNEKDNGATAIPGWYLSAATSRSCAKSAENFSTAEVMARKNDTTIGADQCSA